MNLRKFTAAAVIATAGFLASISGAFAYEAAATTTLNVRSGPGTNFGVVGALSAGQVVEVLECNASNTWCRIQDRTLRGWASAGYLRDVSGGRPSRPVPAPAPAPGISILPGIGITIGTPGVQPDRPGIDRPEPGRPGFGPGPGRPGFGPGPGPRGGEVCFFENYDYRGRSFCARDGETATTLGRGWDKRIRSVEVRGDAEARVCTSRDLRGNCATIDRSVRDLGRLADDISSYRVVRAR